MQNIHHYSADFRSLTEAAWQVRERPSWPRSWANFGLLQLYFHRNMGQLASFGLT